MNDDNKNISDRLQKLRDEAKKMPHTSRGTPEELRAEGLRVFELFRDLRERANRKG